MGEEMKVRKGLRSCAAAAASLTLLAACGSSSSSGHTTPNANGVPKGAPIVIGQIASLSSATVGGGASNMPKAVLDAWVSYINSQGGINGHSVKAITIDDRTNAAAAATAADQLVADHVIAVVGEFATSTQTAWEPIFAKAGIPVVGGSAYIPSWTTDKDMFPANTTIPEGLYGLMLVPHALGATNFGVIDDTSNPTAVQAIALFRLVASKISVPFTAAAGATQATPDYTAQCLSLKQSGTTAVMNDGIINIKKIIDDCARQGYKPIWELPDGGIANESVWNDPNAQGLASPQYEFPWFLDSTPATQLWHQVISKYAPSVLSATDGTVAPATYVWTSAILFQKAATNGISASNASPTSADVLNGLYQIKDDNLGGLVPAAISYTRGQPAPPINCWFYVQLKNGRPVAPTGLTPQCIPGAPPTGHSPGVF
jgi:branched-chain amino acid transport system substrate-binding protein